MSNQKQPLIMQAYKLKSFWKGARYLAPSDMELLSLLNGWRPETDDRETHKSFQFFYLIVWDSMLRMRMRMRMRMRSYVPIGREYFHAIYTGLD